MPQKILLIEDEQDLLDMYGQIFKRHTDFDLLTATNKITGYQTIFEQQPDLVLLDLIIPEKEQAMVSYDKRVGFDLLREIRQKPEARDLTVLIFSNIDTHEDRKLSEELGVAEYLLKADYTPQTLIEKIKKYLNN